MIRTVMVDNDYGDTEVEDRLAAREDVDFAYVETHGHDDVVRAVEGAQQVITSYVSFDAGAIAALPDSVRVICRSGTGYDNVDVDAATARGIAVCNVTGYGTEVVSDHAIALALDCLRQVTACDRALRAGTWSYVAHKPMGIVSGRTFGVVGLGDIGHAAARKAAGLGFSVVVSSHSLEPGTTTPEGWPVLALDDLLARADVVSLHVALVPETRHLIDARRIALLQPDAIVVNTSRGGIVDTVALADALDEGRIWGAGLDVFEDEPLPRDHPLLDSPRTVLTPHVAYYSEESIVELRERTFMNGVRYLRGENVRDLLNPEVREVAGDASDKTADADGAAHRAGKPRGCAKRPET